MDDGRQGRFRFGIRLKKAKEMVEWRACVIEAVVLGYRHNSAQLKDEMVEM
ncbi:MAG: hypothetical protein L6R41_005736 [Letrouitia leprolyta]|nr:MAG: hypothetical protein L6R41_005736 [Letrouitia leprolyta]